ncbi:MAG: hypothetical protein A3H35_19940 [Betaproteobacteria bacterium RIFCSPLOWO2_02_FULL_62_17]|nr:MAG: hypothetical protein A3H35_19940 [Betaproteobacteria bacterium RIFCSPLOWO2_02_FULL_62_17]
MPPVAHRIDVHCHIIPEFYLETLIASGHGTTSGASPAWSPEIALGVMDKYGIASSITSISYPGVHFGDDLAARALARRCNDFAAGMGVQWPGRFGAFAVLPLPDVAGAVAELAHALDQSGMDGVVLLASYMGKYLGDPGFDPLMVELDRRNAVAFVHPGMHPSSLQVGLPWPGFVMEFLFDTTRAAVNLMFSGVIERYPRIRFVLAHAGGLVPYFAWRLSVAPLISTRVPQWTREKVLAGLRHFWYDTALSPGPETMGSLTAVAEPSRILFGSDWPYAPAAITAESVKSLNQAGLLCASERAAIERGNALSLFPRFAG